MNIEPTTKNSFLVKDNKPVIHPSIFHPATCGKEVTESKPVTCTLISGCANNQTNESET